MLLMLTHQVAADFPLIAYLTLTTVSNSVYVGAALLTAIPIGNIALDSVCRGQNSQHKQFSPLFARTFGMRGL